MIDATELKAGKTFLFQNAPYLVVKYIHQKIGRGGANVKLSLRNLNNGNLEEKTFNSNAKVEEISVVKKQLQYLYNDNEKAFFSDPATFEQTEIFLSKIAKEIGFIKEGEIVSVLFWEEEPLSIEIPPKVTLKVKSTSPGVKGNSATNIYKQAVLENGMKVKVPLFIGVGEIIRIDTRTGEYTERAKKD